MEIVIGWWLIPTVISIGTLVYGVWPSGERHGDYDLQSEGIINLLILTVISLASWLIWSLST